MFCFSFPHKHLTGHIKYINMHVFSWPQFPFTIECPFVYILLYHNNNNYYYFNVSSHLLLYMGAHALIYMRKFQSMSSLSTNTRTQSSSSFSWFCYNIDFQVKLIDKSNHTHLNRSILHHSLIASLRIPSISNFMI
mgnify:CR=1 FL=1